MEPAVDAGEKRRTVYAVAVFYIVAVACRYLTNKTDILSGVGNEYIKMLLQGVGPAIGVVVAVLLFKLRFTMTLKGDYRWLMGPFALYWLLPVAAISALVYFERGEVVVLTVFAVLLYGLLEEIGWRGFLQRQLDFLPRAWSILIVAVLWFAWHLNFEVTLSNLAFFGVLLVGSWGIGLVTDKTNSLLAVAAFHSLNNFSVATHNMPVIFVLIVVWIWTIILFRKRIKNVDAADS